MYPKNDQERHHCAIYEFSKAIMDLAHAGPTINTFILPIFSGTLPLTYIGLFPKTSYSIDSLLLNPFPLELSMELVQENLQGITSPILQNKALLKNLLYSCGPFPRSLENIIKIIKEFPNYDLTLVYQLLIDPAIFPLETSQLEEILYYVVSGDRINLTMISSFIYSFIWSGILSIVDDRLFLPLIYAQRFIPKSFVKYPFLLNLFAFPKTFPTSQDIEKFPISFFTFKQQLFFNKGMYQCSVNFFFNGVLSSVPSTTILNLGNFSLTQFESHHTNIVSLQSLQVKGLPPFYVDCETLGSVWVGKQWTQGDGILKFPSHLIITESKLLKDTSQQMAVFGESSNTIEKEREKAFTGPIKPDYFLFCTNAKASSKNLLKFVQNHPDTMVIYYDVWDHVFSHLFWFFKSIST